ncbi:MAG: hypothetical protein MZV49_15150 [Rhodopseudomonas palustris]|nr:hypothetical protein [Rhodopseudomonas palustris]
MQRDGVAPFRITAADKIAELRNLLAPQIKTLEQQLGPAKPVANPYRR